MLQLEDEPAPKKVDAREYVAKLVNEKKYEEAEPLLIKILAQQPDNVWALTALGIVYRSTKKYLAAESCYRKAIELNPSNPEVYSNFGNLLVDMDKFEEALKYSKKAVDLSPESYLFHKNYAVALRETKNHEEALEQYKWCLEQKPDDPDLNFDMAYISLYTRDLETAWEYFEWRFQTRKLRIPEGFKVPKWDGEPLKDKKLLVLAEQGFGDTILLTRFFDRLTEDCSDITFSCKQALHTLFANLPVKLIDEASIVQKDYDFYIPAMSLPRLYEKDWLKWPKAPVMNVPDKAKKRYEWIQDHSKKKLKVGFIWSGSVTYGGNEKRAVDLDRFMSVVASHPNIQFYSFQKGPREADFKEHGLGTVTPLGQSFDDFTHTAAAIENMDLIMMTDSAVVHLSGCLDVPVLDLLQFMPYWLYFPEDIKTPLYPSIRFVRQQSPGDWDGVFAKANDVLRDLAKQYETKPISRERVLSLIDDHLNAK